MDKTWGEFKKKKLGSGEFILSMMRELQLLIISVLMDGDQQFGNHLTDETEREKLHRPMLTILLPSKLSVENKTFR